MATDITYTVSGGVVYLHNVLTREFDQELVYDSTGTDLLGVRYKIGAEAYVHIQQSLASSVPLPPHGIQALDPVLTSLPQQWDRVSQLLLTPRGTFNMTWNGATVLSAGPYTTTFDANTDVENGPKPRGLTVINVSPSAIKVRWSIEFMLSGCPGDSGTPDIRKGPFKIINSRWSVRESRDSEFFTHRQITGTIRFAEGLTAKHAFIGAIIPGLEKGFKREAIEYEASANGLEANYSVSDRQVHYSAPWPATSMEVTHSLTSNDGLTWIDDVQVNLRGSPEADRRQMLARMIQIIDSRCDFLKTVDTSDKRYLIESVAIVEHFGDDNSVSANVTLKNFPQETRQLLGNILEKHLGKPMQLPNLNDPETGDPIPGTDYDRTISRAPALHGYDPHGGERDPAFLFLLTCYWQDPCGQVKNIFGGNQTAPTEDEEEQKTETPYPTPVTTVALQAGSLANYSTEQSTAIYTIARMSSRYVANCLTVALPIATANGSGNTVEFANLGAGMAMRIISYEAERLGDWPKIPAMPPTYSSGDVSGRLLKFFVTQQPPVLSADGQKKIYAITAKICYGLNKMPTGDLAVGQLPYTSLQDAEKKFNFENNQDGSIGP